MPCHVGPVCRVPLQYGQGFFENRTKGGEGMPHDPKNDVPPPADLETLNWLWDNAPAVPVKAEPPTEDKA